jgi:hypothetical protein
MKRNVGRTVLAVALAAVAGEAAGALQVWTLTETRRVLRDEPAGRGLAVKIAAARNEWESFQILVRSDSPVRGLNVKAGDLKGPGQAILRAADARLFRQHQLHLTVGTYRNDEFKPGWYADPLIPFRHPVTHMPLTGARLTAVPFDLPAGQTHGFWVDVHVPGAAKPGEYRGTYRLTAAGTKAVEVPVSMTVWDFELPRVSTMKTALGSPASRMRSYYRRRAKAGKGAEPADWAAVDAQCAEMLTRHRVNATPPSGSIAPQAQADGSFRIPSEQVRALRRFIDRYHVNAIAVPRPTGVVKDPLKEQEKLRAWLASWDRAAAELKRPHVVLYTYLRDEPNDEAAYRFVQKWGRAIREAKSVVKVMVVEQTWTQDPAWGDLYGAVDIWCPLFSLFKPDSAAKRQALGETIWTYTALCQARKTPWWHIDYPLLHYRVPAWIAWRYRMRGLLYWGGMSFWNQVDDPWTDPKTLDRRKGREQPLFNGEGTIVYPGQAVGYDGIAPSLRLKALRDGIEDYEYLAILERLDLAEQAEKVVLPVAGSWFKWQSDPAGYEKARAALAEMIVAANARGKPRR